MAGKRYAILIASSQYPQEPGLTPLRCPENDVDALNEILKSPDLGGFETFVFKNKPHYEILPQINKVLLGDDDHKDDLVLIYYSGHGRLNRAEHLYLTTADTTISTLEASSIPVLELGYYFEHSYCKKKILLLDCCKSGAVGKMFTKGGDDDKLRQMAEANGTFIMTASTANQLAWEHEGDAQSLFTKHLVEGIRSGDADRNEDGWIDMAELFDYVKERVRAESSTQEPLKWHLQASGDLFISRSGTESREKRIEAAKRTLLKLVDDDKLDTGTALEAVHLLSMPKQEMNAKDQECSLLVWQLVSAKISHLVFMKQWYKTCFTHLAAPNAPEPTKEQRVVVLSEPTRIIASAPKQGDIFRDNITSMELVYIPAGCFMMGTDEDSDTKPVHEVCVNAFYLGKYQVTQAQWKKVMSKNPSHFQKGDMYPVEIISWDDVQEFLIKLNKQAGKKYRLPTEAEWEYACKAGGSGKYDIDAVAWYKKNSGKSTHPVGEKQANAFGVYDMLGNVWEWCADWYDSGYYAVSPKDNPQGPDKGGLRVLRGGSSFESPLDCRAVDRFINPPETRRGDIGFRLVLPF